MAEDVSNLIVRMRPEGVDETVQGLNTTEEATKETTEALDGQADAAEGFLQKFEGAMGAVIAGLAVASAGILSQVPVLGEAMSGLFSVVEALAFQLDGALRPSLGGVTDELFDLSGQIYGSGGVLEGLDLIVEKLGNLGMDAVAFTLEGDKLKAGVDGIIEFVFPKINSNEPILDKIFSVDISALAVVAFIFGGLAITTAKLLGFVLPASIGVSTLLSFTLPSIGATQLLVFLLPVIGTAALLNHIFGFNMTKTAILGVIFGGVIIGAAAIVGAISWPVIAGAAIVGTLFAGVGITTAMVLDALVNENAPAAVEGENRRLGLSGETGFVDPREVPVLKQSFQAGQGVRDFLTGNNNSNNGGQNANLANRQSTTVIEVDGRTFGELSSQEQRNITANRNIDG